MRRSTVGVRVEIDTVPTFGGHRVAVKDASGSLVWWTGGEVPEVVQVAQGDEFTISASVPLPVRKGQTPRNSREVWRLRAEEGAVSTVRVGLDGVSRPLNRVVVLIKGASKVGLLESS